MDRDSLGGPESGDGVTQQNFTIPTYGAETGIPLSGIARLGNGPEMMTVALEVDIAGDPITPD